MTTKKSSKSDHAIHVEALRKISDAITSTQYLEDVLKLIVTVTAQVMHSKICSLMLIDTDKNELVLKATQTISDVYNRKPNLKIGHGIAGTVAQNAIPLQIYDVQKDKKYLHRDIAKSEGLRSLLSVPLMVRKKVIGVLNCYTSKPHTFSQTEIDIITTVANQAAIVIENSKILVESQVIREELETRKLIERAKNILMKELHLKEEDAFRRIQKYSMNTRKSFREVAESILTAHAMKQ